MFNGLARVSKAGWVMIFSCLLGACQNYGFKELPSSIVTSSRQIENIPLNPVDILFVVDNSGSMAGEQTQLGESFKNFYSVLNETGGSYHIALVTTGISSSGCQECSDDNPLRCIAMNETGTADIENGRFQYRRGHISWNGADPVFDFTTDPTCRVVTSGNLNCFYNPTEDDGDGRGTVLVGTNGCGYERGLEAMAQALGGDLLGGDNQGFLREDASLAVIIVSDEEDCGEVGYIYELDGNDNYCYHAAKGESSAGKYQAFSSVEDYREFLLSLKGGAPERVKFAAIVGLKPPVNPDDPLDPDATTIEFDANQHVIPVCSTCGFTDILCSAKPGTRYRDLYKAFGEYGFIDTICQNDFSKTMEDIAHFISCPKYFDLIQPPFDLGLANILVNGVSVPRYSCDVLVNGEVVKCEGQGGACSAGSCVATWSYQSPDDLENGIPPVSDPPRGGRISFADHYDPCSLIAHGTLKIELVYVVQ